MTKKKKKIKSDHFSGIAAPPKLLKTQKSDKNNEKNK